VRPFLRARFNIDFAFCDHAFEIMLLDNRHERAPTPLDRQRLSDDVIGPPPQETA
jgi:hypothetical protein